MEIYQDHNYFHVHFDFDQRKVRAVKAIPGARWRGDMKCWIVPLTQSASVDKLKERFTKTSTAAVMPENFGDIPPMPELADEYKAVLKNELLRMPYHYQEQGIAYNLANKRVLNADDMGGGKTTTSICTIVAAGLKNKCGLVVCKGSGKFMWEREFKVVAGMKSIIMRDSIEDTWYNFYEIMGVSVFITNYESLKKYFVERFIDPGKNKRFKPEEHIVWRRHPIKGVFMKDLFSWIIADECHEIRNEGVEKTNILCELAKGKEWRLALSGTPIVNVPFDIYHQLKFLGRTKDTPESKKFFIDRYCAGTKTGKSNLNELRYKLSLNCYFRRNSSEFGIDLPDLTLQLAYADITNRREYEHATKNLRDYLVKMRGKTDAQVEKSMNAEAMVLIGVLMNISARGKMREAVEEIDATLAAGKKIVVFINQREIKEALIKHYPQGLVISGEENAIQKNQAEQEFNNTDRAIPIFVSIKAGGVGINLQTDCQQVLFLELPWHPAFYFQCVKRVHRNGVKGHVMSKNLIGKNTIDERIWEIIESKKELADTITGANDDDVKKEIVDKVKESLFKAA